MITTGARDDAGFDSGVDTGAGGGVGKARLTVMDRLDFGVARTD